MDGTMTFMNNKAPAVDCTPLVRECEGKTVRFYSLHQIEYARMQAFYKKFDSERAKPYIERQHTSALLDVSGVNCTNHMKPHRGECSHGGW